MQRPTTTWDWRAEATREHAVEGVLQKRNGTCRVALFQACACRGFCLFVDGISGPEVVGPETSSQVCNVLLYRLALC